MIKFDKIINKTTGQNLKRKYRKPNQREISNLIFEKDCKDLFREFAQKPDIDRNQHDFGLFIRQHNNEVNEDQLQILKTYISKYLEKNKNSKTNDPFHLVNMIYSLLLKVITSDHLLNHKIKPTSYRQLIDESINMYTSHVLKEGIDYRHVLGRLINLKKMSTQINEKYKMLPKYFEPINWKSEEQLDYIGILEKINKNFETTQSSFSLGSNYQTATLDDNFTPEVAKISYEHGIIKTINILYREARHLMSSPRKNFDEIKSRIETAEYYTDQVPFGSKYGSLIISIIRQLNDLKKQLYSSLRNNKNIQ